jgi:hypothetical protein
MKLSYALVPLAICLAFAAPSHAADQWSAQLSGAESLPATGSQARGMIHFKLQPDGSLRWFMTVANLENITMAHLHLGPRGSSGGIVVWLYPKNPPEQLIPGRRSGILASGTLTASDLRNALQGRSIPDLIALMDARQIFVNVHTTKFGAGEIRGQLERDGR